MTHAVEIATPLGAGAFRFWSMRTSEELARLFEFEIDVSSDRADIDPDALLGTHVSISLPMPEDRVRVFDACVARFGFTGTWGGRAHYRIHARPWLWLLTRSADCRIFEDASVPDILAQVFAAYPQAVFVNRLARNYRVRDCCVQYRETDFDFASRLMEEEGIFYFFEHAAGQHTLVLADDASAILAAPGAETLAFHADHGHVDDDHPAVHAWAFMREVESGACTLGDFDPLHPATDLRVRAERIRPYAESAHEVFDYPGGYAARADGEQLAGVRVDEAQAAYDRAHGESGSFAIASGRRFALSGHPRAEQNREYLVVGASLRIDRHPNEAAHGDRLRSQCSFTAMPIDQPFRPARTTPRPFVHGPQTAIVIGSAGEEIETDAFARVKVRFNWDRRAPGGETSSCWVRVSQPWAGRNFGMIALPRVGDEVVVDFLEGDPDRPIVVGRVYNADHLPPWQLPAARSQTGILTRSTPGGTPANANALRFEDRAGSEQVWLHAERNLDTEVERDETHWVGRERMLRVDGSETRTIGLDRQESVGRNLSATIGNDHASTVTRNDSLVVGQTRNHTVGGNESITVGESQEVSVGAAQSMTVGAVQSLTVGGEQRLAIGANQTVAIGASGVRSVGTDEFVRVGRHFVVEAGESITLRTGNASIVLARDGTITIRGNDVALLGIGNMDIRADGDIVIRASRVDVQP